MFKQASEKGSIAATVLILSLPVIYLHFCVSIGDYMLSPVSMSHGDPQLFIFVVVSLILLRPICAKALLSGLPKRSILLSHTDLDLNAARYLRGACMLGNRLLVFVRLFACRLFPSGTV